MLTDDNNIRILSGRYGLLQLTDSVTSYDELITESITATVLQQAHGLPGPVTCFLQKRYAAIAKQVWPDAQYIFDGSRGGIAQMTRCYKIIKECS